MASPFRNNKKARKRYRRSANRSSLGPRNTRSPERSRHPLPRGCFGLRSSTSAGLNRRKRDPRGGELGIIYAGTAVRHLAEGNKLERRMRLAYTFARRFER